MVLGYQQGSKLRSFQLLPALPLEFFALVNKLESKSPMVCYNRSPFFLIHKISEDSPMTHWLHSSKTHSTAGPKPVHSLQGCVCPLLAGSWASAEPRPSSSSVPVLPRVFTMTASQPIRLFLLQ